MGFLSNLLCIFIFYSFFPLSAFSLEEEVMFKLKRKERKRTETKRKNLIPSKFRRESFSYSKDFVVFNESPKSDLKPGTVLKVNIPYSVIASFDEEFPLYGVVVSPFKGIISGKIKGVKNTNRASVSFDGVIVNGEVQKIKSFPVFFEGDLKEAILKDIFLNFFESLPSVLTLALRTQIPQTGIHFINSDLQNKMGKLSFVETEKRKRLQYLELKDIKLFKLVIQ